MRVSAAVDITASGACATCQSTTLLYCYCYYIFKPSNSNSGNAEKQSIEYQLVTKSILCKVVVVFGFGRNSLASLSRQLDAAGLL